MTSLCVIPAHTRSLVQSVRMRAVKSRSGIVAYTVKVYTSVYTCNTVYSLCFTSNLISHGDSVWNKLSLFCIGWTCTFYIYKFVQVLYSIIMYEGSLKKRVVPRSSNTYFITWSSDLIKLKKS